MSNIEYNFVGDLDKITETLKEIWYDRIPTAARRMTIGQYCKTNGLVVRDSASGFNLCDDPECVSCQNWDRLLKEEIQKLSKDIDPT